MDQLNPALIRSSAIEDLISHCTVATAANSFRPPREDHRLPESAGSGGVRRPLAPPVGLPSPDPPAGFSPPGTSSVTSPGVSTTPSPPGPENVELGGDVVYDPPSAVTVSG